MLAYYRLPNPIEADENKRLDDYLAKHRITNENPAMGFDFGTAILIHKTAYELTPGDYHRHFVIERLYKTPAGAYYFCIQQQPDAPLLVHFTRERAMNALRDHPRAFQAEFPDE